MRGVVNGFHGTLEGKHFKEHFTSILDFFCRGRHLLATGTALTLWSMDVNQGEIWIANRKRTGPVLDRTGGRNL